MKSRTWLSYLAIIALLIWGGVFVYFHLTGRIDKHIDVNFRTWALVAGMGLIVLGLFNLATARQTESCCGHDHEHGDGHDEHDHNHDHQHDECCGHDHEHSHADHHEHEHEHHHHHGPVASSLVTAVLILTVPLLSAAHFSPDKFSAPYIAKWDKIEQQMRQMRLAERRAAAAANQKTAASIPADQTETPTGSATVAAAGPTTTAAVTQADTPPSAPTATKAADTPPADKAKAEADAKWSEFTMADLERMVPKNEAGNFLLDVPQIFYTAGDEELMKVMEGIPIETTAQVMEETLNNPKGTRLKLFRLFVECCAADARPLSVPIDFGKTPPKYESMGWVKIIGKLHYSHETDGAILPVIQVQTMEATAEPVDMMVY
jgi:uncharacterized membrane protein YcgQ (UPF0703/DUF1980 family)